VISLLRKIKRWVGLNSIADLRSFERKAVVRDDRSYGREEG
jgi:hypothetical protein